MLFLIGTRLSLLKVQKILIAAGAAEIEED